MFANCDVNPGSPRITEPGVALTLHSFPRNPTRTHRFFVRSFEFSLLPQTEKLTQWEWEAAMDPLVFLLGCAIFAIIIGVVIIKLFGSRRNSAYVSDVDAEQDAIENKYNALREEVLPKAEMGTRRRLNEQEPLKPVRS